MMKQVRTGKAVFAAQLVVLCLFLSSCATTATIAGSKSLRSVEAVDGGAVILPIPPKITYERLENEAPLDGAKFGEAKIVGVAITDVTHILSEKGFRLLKVGTKTEQITALQTLKAESNRLAVSRNVNEFLPQLHALSPDSRDRAVLAQYYRVKVGPGGYWNPINGAIASAMSSTVLHAALIDCKTGRILWHNEVVLREAPSIKNGEFRKALEVLYRPLKRKEQ